MKVWFTNDAETISTHMLTEAPPPASAYGMWYRVRTNPSDDAATGCLVFHLVVPSSYQPVPQAPPLPGIYQGEQVVKLVDGCADGANPLTSGVEGTAKIEEAEDGRGLITLTFPRSYSPLLADGQKLTAPNARTDLAVGTDDPDKMGWVGFRLDDTKVGTDYEIQSDGSSASPPAEEPPGENDPPGKGKKKGCKKGKGKKKGRCPKPEPEPAAEACAPYAPGEQGAGAETTVVTDAATAEAPIEIPIGTEPGVPEARVTHTFHNIQVDSTAPSTGLHARFEFDLGQDYDIYLFNAAGEEQAQAAGTNQALVIPGEPYGQDNDEGGHSEPDAEALDGVTTADCGGYTMDIASYFSEGGEYTLKLWLGEATYTPGGGELQAAALSLF